MYHRPITHFTLLFWFACLFSHYYHHWRGCLQCIQEKRLFDIMAHEVGTFLGEAAEVLQIQMEKWFFFLNPGDGHSCKAHQSNALLQYIYFFAERGEYLHWLVLIWLAVPSARQHNSASSKSNNNLLLYVTGRTVLCLDSLPLISLLRLLLPISSNFKMCGFQRSRIHVPSFGEAFLYYSFVVIRISLLHVYNKTPPGGEGGDTEGKYCQGLKPW